jgi:hypothetical protein
VAYRAADFGGAPDQVENRSGFPLYKEVELDWEGPFEWTKGKHAPVSHNEACLYILQHEHWRAHTRMKILYVGLTINPQTRFLNHPTATAIVGLRGQAFLSYAVVKFMGKNQEARTKRTLEEIEHLLIWAAWHDDLKNDRKTSTLPGMGSRGGTAWHIRNSGYRFQGQLPIEIAYPWMLVRPGRNRSAK